MKSHDMRTPQGAAPFGSRVNPQADPNLVAHLLATLERIPRSELPDGDARAALVAAIRSGKVIGCYTPVGYRTHVIELGDMPADCDPRVTCAQWAAWVRAGVDPATEHTAAQRRMQEQARDFWAAREEQARVFLQQRQSQQRASETTEQGGR